MWSIGTYFHKRKNEVSIRRRGVLPKNILYIDGEQQRYVWLKPSHRAPITFDPKSGIKDRTIIHPTLIFCCHGDSLFVHASSTDSPTEHTQLRKAPYLNIYDNEENLCKGNINMARVNRAETHQGLIDAWEDVFFKSRFSHGLGTIIPQNNKKLSNDKYIEMLSRAKKFPYNTLHKTTKQLKSLFR